MARSARSIQRGNLLWRYRTDNVVSAPPVIDRDGTLYFGSRTGRLYAVIDNSGGPADTPWPMYRHDQAGTSCASTGIPRGPQTVTKHGLPEYPIQGGITRDKILKVTKVPKK